MLVPRRVLKGGSELGPVECLATGHGRVARPLAYRHVGLVTRYESGVVFSRSHRVSARRNRARRYPPSQYASLVRSSSDKRSKTVSEIREEAITQVGSGSVRKRSDTKSEHSRLVSEGIAGQMKLATVATAGLRRRRAVWRASA